MTDLLTYLSPAHTWDSESGSPWPEVTPLEELIAAARWALQQWDKEPAQTITGTGKRACPQRRTGGSCRRPMKIRI